jgi:hypothetical protein
MDSRQLLQPISDFIDKQGIAALFAVGLAIFGGTVVWGMSSQLDEHVRNDSENSRLLRVICESVAKDEGWRRACVDAAYDNDQLGKRIAAYQGGSAEASDRLPVRTGN